VTEALEAPMPCSSSTPLYTSYIVLVVTACMVHGELWRNILSMYTLISVLYLAHRNRILTPPRLVLRGLQTLLPPTIFDETIRDTSGTPTCTICTDVLDLGDVFNTRSCNHSFHASCIGDWVKENPICPNCRSPIVISHNL
jgi:Ring finger domain